MALVHVLADSITGLSHILENAASQSKGVVPQAFRDAWACHVYMIYTFLVFFESHIKEEQQTSEKNKINNAALEIRYRASSALVQASECMASNSVTLWPRGVSDESVVILPTRVAYTLLEATSSGSASARKAACADEALRIIAATIRSDGGDAGGANNAMEGSSLVTMVTAALMDLMFSFEHVAPLVAELCTLVDQGRSTNKLGLELLREYSRLDQSSHTSDAKSTGIKNVAPFLAHIAQVRPRLVLSQLSQLMPLLEVDTYYIRSAVVTAFGHVLENLNTSTTTGEEGHEETNTSNDASTKAALLDLLTERAHDVSSYTRSTVLKVWINLVESQRLPKERVMATTNLALDRLHDKTVLVRRQAMQVWNE